MKTSSKLATLGITAALALAPTAALASTPSHGHSSTSPGHTKQTTPPTTSNTHAFGKFCQGESKTHVKGQKGTPFSQCVTAMAKLAHHKTNNPHVACKGMSTKHVKGQKGTPYSQCVVAGNRLLQAQRKAGK